MTKAEQIAERLTEGTDLALASALVAMDADHDVIGSSEAETCLEPLRDLGLITDVALTSLGRDVAKELRRKGVLIGNED